MARRHAVMLPLLLSLSLNLTREKTRQDKTRQDKTRQDKMGPEHKTPNRVERCSKCYHIEVFLPGPRPEGRTTGEPETHTQSVDNKGLLVVIRGKQGREGRREKLSSSHFNAFSHWIIIVIFMKNNNKILVFILSSILLIVDCTKLS